MMLIMLYDTGARVQELADMNISSLHLKEKNPFVTLIGKGRKSRSKRQQKAKRQKTKRTFCSA